MHTVIMIRLELYAALAGVAAAYGRDVVKRGTLSSGGSGWPELTAFDDTFRALLPPSSLLNLPLKCGPTASIP